MILGAPLGNPTLRQPGQLLNGFAAAAAVDDKGGCKSGDSHAAEFRPLYPKSSSSLNPHPFRFLDVPNHGFQKRIADILREQKITAAELGRVAKVTKGLVSQWVNGPSQSMSYDSAKNIGAKWGYAVEWLMKGDGPKMAKARRKNVEAGPDVQQRVPLISWVQAGKFSEAEDVYRVGEAEDWYPMPRRAGPQTYCLRVEGDSMTASHGRSYPAGCVIFVDPEQRSPANGKRVIAKLEGSDEVTFKVFVQDAGRTFLRPLNSSYPPITEPFKVIGTVIGKWEDD